MKLIIIFFSLLLSLVSLVSSRTLEGFPPEVTVDGAGYALQTATQPTETATIALGPIIYRYGTFDGMNVEDTGMDMRGCGYAEAPCGVGYCPPVRLLTALLVPCLITDSLLSLKFATATVKAAAPRGKLYSCCPLRPAQLTIVQRR